MSIENLLTYANIIGLLTLGFLQWRTAANSQKTRGAVDQADAQNKIGTTYDMLIKNLRAEVEELREQVGALRAADATKEARITLLEKENKKLQRGFARAVNHIKYLAPNEPIPDFLQDTGELNVK